ncbi:MAG: hypothetical protein ACREH6_06435 [Geminicoccaceae bacterium]
MGSLSHAYLHLVASVLLTGYALFWALLARSLGRKVEAGESGRLLALAGRARWPHVGVPLAWRLPLPWVGWAFLLVAAITGVLLLAGTPVSGVLLAKLLLLVALVLVQLMLTVRPAPTLAYLNLAAVVLIVALSALLRR